MAVMEETRLAYDEIKSGIGAEVLAGKDALLSGVHAADLRELLERRGVLVFPKVDFTEEELVAFTRTLGEFAPDGGGEMPTLISIDPAGGATADYTRASFFW